MTVSDENTFENNKKLVTEHVDVHPDDIIVIDSTVNKLAEAGVGKLKTVKVEEADTWGWVLCLTNEEDHVFYLELNKYGGIVLLRKDGSQGEVLSAILHDPPEGMEFPEDAEIDDEFQN